MEFRILDESELPRARSGRSKYAALYEALDKLPDGKWVEFPVEEGDLPSNVGLSIAQSGRVGRKPYKITYRTDRVRHVVYISKLPLNGNGHK